MSHTLLLGRTGSGKTLYAKAKCFELSKITDKQIVIFEPFYKTKWLSYKPILHFQNIYALQDYLKTHSNCVVFIDESGEALNRDITLNYLATRTRHNNHDITFITQRANQLLPTIRNNCENFVSFYCSKSDSIQLSQDSGNEDFLRVPTLNKYEYLEFCDINNKALKTKNVLKEYKDFFKHYGKI